MKKTFRTIAVCAITCVVLLGAFLFTHDPSSHAIRVDRKPHTYPDYDGVTIPYNIAPTNFQIEEDGASFYCVVYGEAQGQNGRKIVSRSARVDLASGWRALLEENVGGRVCADVFVKGTTDKKWRRYETITMDVSPDPIDGWLAYRLLAPGYDYGGWITLEERELATFKTTELFDNRGSGTCVNCHAFQNRRAESFLSTTASAAARREAEPSSE